MEKYTYSIEWCVEDNSYIATIKEIAGLSAFGDTPEGSLKEAQIALKGFLEVYKEDNI